MLHVPQMNGAHAHTLLNTIVVTARMFFFNAMELVSFKIEDTNILPIQFKPRGADDRKFTREEGKGSNVDPDHRSGAV